MMKQVLNYCIVLSSDQLSFMAGSKYGIDRMKILHLLIQEVALKTTIYKKKGFSVSLNIGQCVFSEVDLANRLNYDKKTISRVIDRMNQLGIITSEQSNRTSVHTLNCISAWMLNNESINNPFYVPIRRRNSIGNNTPQSDDAKQEQPSNGCNQIMDSVVNSNIPIYDNADYIPDDLPEPPPSDLFMSYADESFSFDGQQEDISNGEYNPQANPSDTSSVPLVDADREESNR